MLGTSLTCANCLFFEADNHSDGACRRYPPAVDPISGDMNVPSVSVDDWCGEHRPRPGSLASVFTPEPPATSGAWYDTFPVEGHGEPRS